MTNEEIVEREAKYLGIQFNKKLYGKETTKKVTLDALIQLICRVNTSEEFNKTETCAN